MIGKVHHFGFLVKNIRKSVETFQIFGYEFDKEITFDDIRKAEICFLKKNGERIELVAPHPESDLFPLLKKYNNTIYHICYETDDLDTAIQCLKGKGFLLFKEKQAAPAISVTAEVAFLMHINLGIVELIQKG